MSDWVRPCACGSTVRANPDDPAPGVATHNATPCHRAYSDATSVAPPRLPSDPPTAVRPHVDLSAWASVRPGIRRAARRRPRIIVRARRVA